MIGYGPLDKPFPLLCGRQAGEGFLLPDNFAGTTLVEIRVLLKLGHLRQCGPGLFEIVSIPWQNRRAPKP